MKIHELIVVLRGVYYPMKAYGLFDDEALVNDFHSQEHDDVDIDQFVEELMQRFEEQQLKRMNG